MTDIKVAIRALRKTPGFSIVALLTIAVGIGANTALFSVYDRLVLRPVTIPDPDSLVAVWTRNPQLNFNAPAVSWPRYEEIRAGTRVFASVGISAFDNFSLTNSGDPEQLNGQRIDSTFLPTLGIMPALGRNFTAEEDQPNGPAVCIISHELWQARFGGRPSIVGEAITLNGVAWQVVGVMPPNLTPPFQQVQVMAPRVFEVGGLTPLQVQAGAGYAQPIARLKRGVSLEQAAADLAAISRGSREQFPARLDANNTSEPLSYVGALVGNLRPAFYTLLGAVGFVLLIACANVASLFLGRLTARQKEVAIRRSLGATHARIVRQFVIESLILAVAAGAVGTLLGMWALQVIQALLGATLPPNTTLAINPRALLFTAGITAATALLVGLAPAIQASRGELVAALKDAARGSSGERGRALRGALIVGEVALSIVLLVGSGLLLMSFLALQRTPPGFEPRGVATAFVGVPPGRYSTPAQQAQFFEDVIERLRALPMVKDAAVAIGLPLSGFNPRFPYSVEGRPILPLPQRPLANLAIVSENYFSLLRISFVAGRAFTEYDREGAPGVCIINQSLASRLFPGENALGKVMLRGPNATLKAEVVGVIHDVKSIGLNVPAPDEVYYPVRQLGRPGMNVIARTDGDPATLQSVMRAAVASADKDQPISFFATLETNIAQSLGAQRIVASLTTIFAGLALVLSAIGLYSVVAYLVSQRTAEIGIRMALGAQPAQVVGLVLRSGMKLVAIGVVLGLAGAAGTARAIQTLLFQVRPIDPIVYAVVAAVFTIVATLACLVPSWRASRIDPLIALRAE